MNQALEVPISTPLNVSEPGMTISDVDTCGLTSEIRLDESQPVYLSASENPVFIQALPKTFSLLKTMRNTV